MAAALIRSAGVSKNPSAYTEVGKKALWQVVAPQKVKGGDVGQILQPFSSHGQHVAKKADQFEQVPQAQPQEPAQVTQRLFVGHHVHGSDLAVRQLKVESTDHLRKDDLDLVLQAEILDEFLE